MKRFLSYQYVRFPVAAVLVFAVLTKTYQVATEPADSLPWLEMGHVFFESGLALLLLSGVWPRWIKWATAAVFAVFFCVAANLALKSADSCGCFGNVQVDPRITAALDAIIVLLLFFSSVEERQEYPSRKQVALIAGGMFLTTLLFIPMSLRPPVQRVDHGTVVAETVKEIDDVVREDEPSGLVPTEFRIGYVEPQSIHRFTLEIANPSGENWPLDSVDTECDCLLVAEKPDHLAPGKTPLTIEFTTPDITGVYSKTITVSSGEQQWTTRFHARIDTPLAVEPEILVFGPDDLERRFVVHNDGKVPVRLLYATSTANAYTVKIGPEPIAPNAFLALVATWNGTPSAGEQTITIHTNFSRQKMLRIPVRRPEIP